MSAENEYNPLVTVPVPPSQGGTGIVNNDASTITVSGAFGLTLTLSALTNVTLPTSGTLLSTAAVVTPAQGGTGIANNNASTLAISGNFATTFTVTGVTGVTLPTSGTLATLAGVETLSNKTLTAAKIVSGGFIADANGNEQLIFVTTASAVNEVTHTNAATGTNPIIAGTGGDANVGLDFVTKADGVFGFNGFPLPFQSEDLVFFTEDFISGLTGDGTFGSMGWRTNNYTGTGAFTISLAEANHPGVCLVQTGAVLNDESALCAAIANSAQFINFCDSAAAQITIVFRLNSTAGLAVILGMVGDASNNVATATIQNGIYLRFDTTGDTNFMFCCTAAASTTATSSGVAADTNWHNVRMRRASASSVEFSLDRAAWVAVATNVPTTGFISPVIRVKSLTALTAKNVNCDLFNVAKLLSR